MLAKSSAGGSARIETIALDRLIKTPISRHIGGVALWAISVRCSDFINSKQVRVINWAYIPKKIYSSHRNHPGYGRRGGERRSLHEFGRRIVKRRILRKDLSFHDPNRRDPSLSRAVSCIYRNQGNPFHFAGLHSGACPFTALQLHEDTCSRQNFPHRR